MERKKTVLLVEDEENDIFLMQRAVRKMNEPVTLQVARTGEQAIAYLAGENEYANRQSHPLPSLILLDIRMPRKIGFDVLEWVRSAGQLSDIPVVIVTSIKIPSIVEKARELGASACLVKPVALDALQRLFTVTEEFLLLHALP